MQRAIAGWFTDAPIADPIERRLAPLLIAVLSLSPLAAVQAALVLATSPLDAPTLVRVGLNGLIGAGGVAGLVLVKRGRFRLAVLVSAYTFIVAFSIGNICLGLYEHRSQLAQHIIPLAFLGLLLERRWLLGGITLIIATTIVAAALNPGLTPPQARSPTGRLVLVVSSFVLLVVFLAVLFDRFSVTTRGALAAALTRERELEEVRRSLEARTTESSASTTRCSARWPSGAGSKASCCRRRRWTASAVSPVASRTTSTTCSPSSSATPKRCARRFPKGNRGRGRVGDPRGLDRAPPISRDSCWRSHGVRRWRRGRSTRTTSCRRPSGCCGG